MCRDATQRVQDAGGSGWDCACWKREGEQGRTGRKGYKRGQSHIKQGQSGFVWLSPPPVQSSYNLLNLLLTIAARSHAYVYACWKDQALATGGTRVGVSENCASYRCKWGLGISYWSRWGSLSPGHWGGNGVSVTNHVRVFCVWVWDTGWTCQGESSSRIAQPGQRPQRGLQELCRRGPRLEEAATL